MSYRVHRALRLLMLASLVLKMIELQVELLRVRLLAWSLALKMIPEKLTPSRFGMATLFVFMFSNFGYLPL